MTPAARATALIVGVLGALFAAAATAGWHGYGAWLRWREHRRAQSRHVRIGRHRRCGRHECDRAELTCWLVGLAVRFVREEAGGPKSGVVFGLLFLAFSVLIGANT